MDQYKSFVGPEDKYDQVASMQFNLLTLMGLRDHHKLLDIGCGSLRAGRLFISYLKKNNYYGIEPEEWLVKEGIDNELGSEFVSLKAPNFIYSHDFEVKEFSQPFDYVVAQSVFSHTSKQQMSTCIQEVADSLKTDGVFLATAYLGDKDYQGAEWVYPECIEFTKETVSAIASESGLSIKVLDWPHPNSQTWIAFYHQDKATLINDPMNTDLKRLYIENIDVKQYVDDIDGTGCWDTCRCSGNKYLNNGWARNPLTNNPASKVIITDQDKYIVATANVFNERQDVADHFENNDMLTCGWEAQFSSKLLNKGHHSLRAYALDLESMKAYRIPGDFDIEVA